MHKSVNAEITGSRAARSKLTTALLGTSCLGGVLLATPAAAQSTTSTCEASADYATVGDVYDTSDSTSVILQGSDGWTGKTEGDDGGDAPTAPSLTLLNCQMEIFEGIEGQSLGGRGGEGKDSFLISPGTGGRGGDGGTVLIENPSQSTIISDSQAGIYGYSLGGNGGNGGGTVGFGSGATGGAGGNGGDVTLLNLGEIQTSGLNAPGMLAVSEGGMAGTGGECVCTGHAGTGGAGGNSSGTATARNDGEIVTSGDQSSAIVVRSVGGNGNYGGSAYGFVVTIGGNGGAAGDGGDVNGINNGSILTAGTGSRGMDLSSVGGGGNSGGSAFDISPLVSIAIGGIGGSGGTPDNVIGQNSGSIITQGFGASGMYARSLGGGGGDGGAATAASVGTNFAFTMAMGGRAGGGGNGGDITLTNEKGGSIVTGLDYRDLIDTDSLTTLPGNFSAGMVAQSIGGGGGSGHRAFALSASISSQFSLAISLGIGGAGGSGGSGGNVVLNSAGYISTSGFFAPGMLAHSVGGGGGDGGSITTVDASVGNLAGSVSLDLAGSAGVGGSGGNVTADVSGTIITIGMGSAGVIAESISGGGGNGGNVVDGTGSLGDNAINVSVSLGGSGGSGEQGGNVTGTVASSGMIETYGDLAVGFLAHSVGGGGGNGGAVHSYAVGLQGGSGMAATGTVSVGGNAGYGASGGTVTQNIDGSVVTHGLLSSGVVAQSVGGGGGNGGHVFGLDIDASLDTAPTGNQSSSMQANVNVGGTGGDGGDGGIATLNLTGSITTSGALSAGAVVQSIGGGGGNGGNAHSFSLATSLPQSLEGLQNRLVNNAGSLFQNAPTGASNLSITVDVGRRGGSGGNGGAATAILGSASITTNGNMANGLTVQSIGGGGGTAGNVVGNGFLGIGTTTATINVGGSAGAGGTGGVVTVKAQDGSFDIASIATKGDQSYGVYAQSIGGGGGFGGSTSTTEYSAPGLSGHGYHVSVGGSGGGGASGGNVLVRDVQVQTTGNNSYAIVAQSIGGGGGTGAVADASGGYYLDIGGSGGSGNHGGTVSVLSAAAATGGAGGIGVLAQSIGGGGGNASAATSLGLFANAEADAAHLFNLNHRGGNGNGGDVQIGCVTTPLSSDDDCNVSVVTYGDMAIGVLAQSIGGGGGLVHATNTGGGSIDYTIGATGDASGSSGRVSIVTHYISPTGNVTTSGNGAIGILAQSFDSGGGTFIMDSTPATVTDQTSDVATSGNNGGVTIDLSTNVTTSGNHAIGILGQALSNAYVLLTPDGMQLYGSAANGTNTNHASNQLFLRLGSSVSTSGDYAHGVMLQTSSSLAATNENDPDLAQALSGYGSDRAQTIAIAGDISVSGANSWAINSINHFTGSVAADEYTTHILIDSNATITSGDQSAGGIFVDDNGSVALDVYGAINASNGAAISATAGHQLDVNVAGIVTGDVNLSLAESSVGSISLTLTTQGDWEDAFQFGGAISGAVNLKAYGGSIKIDGGYGAIVTDSGVDALTIDTTNADITLGYVLGDIRGPQYTDAAHLASLTSMGTFFGTIDGAFAYKFGSLDAAHGLNISGSGGLSDYISVGSYQLGGPGGGARLNLTDLPTDAFVPLKLIDVASGMPSSGTAEALFGLSPDTLATHYDISVLFPSDGAATAMLNGITVDFTKAGLTGNLQQVAALANAQLAAYASGDSTVLADTNLVNYLLLGANETQLQYLQDELTIIEPSLHYGTAQSDAAAIQAALTDMQSCGDASLASVDPIAQGQCNWAKYNWRNGEYRRGAQRDQATGLAMGHQFQVGRQLHLGLSGVYEDTKFRSATAHSNGSRIGVGGILKWNDARNFGSVSVMGSYSWADGTRTVVLPGDIGPAMTARSDHESLTFTTRLRGGHKFDLKPFDLIAMADADMVVLHNRGYTERGAGSLNITVAPTTNVVFDLRPAAQLGTHFDLGGVSVRAYGQVGYRFRFGDLHIRAGLAEGYDTDFLTQVTSHRDPSLPTYGGGLILDLSDRLEARLNYDLEKGDHDRIEKLSIKAALKF